MTKDEALKLALEALEGVLDDAPKVMDASIAGGLYEVVQCRDAITAIKEALAQTQEPVAWGVFDDNLHDMFFAKEEAQEMVRLKGDGSTVKPLYTTPPQRKPLTDEEIWKFWWARPEVPESEDDSMEAEFVAAVRAVLAAHGIKE
jgi:hypothetical protein